MCFSYQVELLRSERCGRGIPTMVDVLKMCTVGERIRSLKKSNECKLYFVVLECRYSPAIRTYTDVLA